MQAKPGDLSREDDLAAKFGIKRFSADPKADHLASLLVDHHMEPWPSDVRKGGRYGTIEAVLAQPDVFGWALSAWRGSLSDTDRTRLAEYANEIESSLGSFPPIGRKSFERLMLLARTAVEFRVRPRSTTK